MLKEEDLVFNEKSSKIKIISEYLSRGGENKLRNVIEVIIWPPLSYVILFGNQTLPLVILTAIGDRRRGREENTEYFFFFF